MFTVGLLTIGVPSKDCHSERSEESLTISSILGQPLSILGCCSQSALRSNQRGFAFSIKEIFFGAEPAFEFLFAGDGGIHVSVVIEPDESIEVIALGESGCLAAFMLGDSALKIVCHADIKSGAMFVRDDVDLVVVIAHRLQK